MIPQLPVIKNLFSKPAMQAYLAKQLAGKELKLFDANYGLDDDGNKIWDWTHPDNYSNDNCYYTMLGVDIDIWVFAPSMVGIPFRIDGDWYTVTKTEVYNIIRLPNGDEADVYAEQFI